MLKKLKTKNGLYRKPRKMKGAVRWEPHDSDREERDERAIQNAMKGVLDDEEYEDEEET